MPLCPACLCANMPPHKTATQERMLDMLETQNNFEVRMTTTKASSPNQMRSKWGSFELQKPFQISGSSGRSDCEENSDRVRVAKTCSSSKKISKDSKGSNRRKGKLVFGSRRTARYDACEPSNAAFVYEKSEELVVPADQDTSPTSPIQSRTGRASTRQCRWLSPSKEKQAKVPTRVTRKNIPLNH